jgi:hypothetical protein
MNWQEIWSKILSNIKETINLHLWTELDLSCLPSEQIILNAWQLRLTLSPPTIILGHPTKISSSQWKALRDGYLKINFDGASKGNLAPTGFGATIHNNKGEILLFTVGNLGHNTNNAADLWGLLKGLQTTMDQGMNFLIAEGDS